MALASLQQDLDPDEIDPLSCTVLNTSNHGVERLKQEHATERGEPWPRVTKAKGVALIIDVLSE